MVSNSNKSLLVPFLRDKLLVSIYESCKHRPAALLDAGDLTRTIISKLVFSDEGKIQSDDIAKATYDILLRFDPVAATFYKAFHPIS